MKLYDLAISPFSARVRIVARLKGLDIECVPPPLALKSAEFKARHALGKIPILELEDGETLAESWAIMEYLDERFSQISLSPTDALARAQMRVRGRVADLYLGPALFPIFSELTTPESPERTARIQRQLQACAMETAKLDRVFDATVPLGERAIDLGDIALATTAYFVDAIPPLFDTASPVALEAGVARWWRSVNDAPAIKQTLAEIDAAFRGFLDKIGHT